MAEENKHDGVAPSPSPTLPLSVAQLIAALDALDEALLVQDATGTVVFVNDVAARMCGFASAGEMLRASVAEVIARFTMRDEEGRPYPPAHLPARRVFAGEPAAEAVIRFHLRPSGQERWSLVKATAVSDEAHAVRYVVSVFRDISDRIRAERQGAVQHAVSMALATAHDLDEAAPAIVRAIGEGLEWQVTSLWLVAPDADVLRPCATWQAGVTATAFVAETDARTFTRGIGLPGRVWASGEPTWITDVVANGNFPRAPIAATAGLHAAFAFPVWGNGRVIGVIECFSGYITLPDDTLLHTVATLGNQIGQFVERTRATTAVRESEARKGAILDTALDCIISIDHSGRIIEWNPAAEETFGHRRDDVIGQELATLIIPPALREQHRHGLAHYLATGDGPALGKRIEMTGMRADGAEFPVELAITRIPGGGLPIFTAYLRDISERKAAEESRMTFLGMVAHDLRTPLTSLKGYVELMRRRGLYNERYMEIVALQADRLDRLVSDVLDVTRLDAQRLQLRRDTMDLTLLARTCAEEVQQLTDAHAIRVEAPMQPLVGSWDTDRVHQVLLNLLSNAIKYAPGGDIIVRVAERGDTAEISVQDSGPGIPPDDLPHLFERFYRAESTKESLAKGMGLGLYITKGLVEAHGGRIWVEPTPGGGSTFVFTLPAAADTDYHRPT